MMALSPLLLALLCLPQDPAPASAPGRDRITLKLGGTVEGTLLQDTKDYLEIRLDDGTVVGFERKLAATVERGIAASAAPVSPPARVALARDQWYLLHDGEGKLGGRMHETCTLGEEIRIGEEWEFRDDKSTTEVTILEVLSAELMPLWCFYHERTRQNGDERLVSERIVRATVHGDRLQIERKTLLKDETRNYDFPHGATFPLAALERLRREVIAGGLEERMVFDPAREELVRRKFQQVLRRKVEHNGSTVEVREVRTGGEQGGNIEWCDASGKTIRREVNGPALVAVPAQAETAKGLQRFAGEVRQTALRREEKGRFGMWLPNPNWRFDDGLAAGQIRARAAIHSARVNLVLLENLDKDLSVDSAADSVQRWLELTDLDLRLERRSETQVRGARAVCLEAGIARFAASGPQRVRLKAYVFPALGRLMAFVAQAPAEDFGKLEVDFQRMLQTVEALPEKK